MFAWHHSDDHPRSPRHRPHVILTRSPLADKAEPLTDRQDRFSEIGGVDAQRIQAKLFQTEIHEESHGFNGNFVAGTNCLSNPHPNLPTPAPAVDVMELTNTNIPHRFPQTNTKHHQVVSSANRLEPSACLALWARGETGHIGDALKDHAYISLTNRNQHETIPRELLPSF